MPFLSHAFFYFSTIAFFPQPPAPNRMQFIKSIQLICLPSLLSALAVLFPSFALFFSPCTLTRARAWHAYTHASCKTKRGRSRRPNTAKPRKVGAKNWAPTRFFFFIRHRLRATTRLCSSFTVHSRFVLRPTQTCLLFLNSYSVCACVSINSIRSSLLSSSSACMCLSSNSISVTIEFSEEFRFL